MKKRYFNKRAKRRVKFNLKKNANRKRLFSKRMGGIIGVSVLMENRNVTAADLSNTKKEIL